MARVMVTDHVVTLDRDERESLRHEAAAQATGYGDLKYFIARGQRAAAYDELRDITACMSLLDHIGWWEGPDTPAEQQLTVSPRLADWASRCARGLVASFADDPPSDTELAGLCALRRIAVA